MFLTFIFFTYIIVKKPKKGQDYELFEFQGKNM